MSTIAMFFLGFVLYSSTVLIPQISAGTAGIHGASLSGMALSPGGAVIMFMMPVVGFLVSKVDTRLLITFGCMVSATALFVMAGWDLQLDYQPRGDGAHVAELRAGVFVYSDQRVGVRVRAKRKDEHGHGNHQSGAKHRGERGNCDGDDDAAAAHAVSPVAVDGAREFSLSAAYQNAMTGTQIAAGVGGFDDGARGGAGARNDLRHGAAAGGDAGVHRQL